MLVAVLAASQAFAAPPRASLKAKLDEAAPTSNAASILESGKAKRGGSSTITLMVDPAKETFILSVCDDCYMFSLIATDESGKQLAASYGESEPMVLIEPGMTPSGKVKVTIDMTSGCEQSTCAWAVGLYY